MNIVIVEDSRLARQELCELLTHFPEHDVIGQAENLAKGIQQLEQLQPDLVLLDIQLPDGDGFMLLEQLSFAPRVIFTTAYDEYAVKAFKVNALDYLLKPVSQESLASALQKANAGFITTSKSSGKKSKQEQIFFRDGERCYFVRLADIYLFEVDGNYTRIYSKDGHAMMPRSLSYLSERLDEKEFFRANRQQIVNMDYVNTIEPWINDGLCITLQNGQQIEVSRRQATELRRLLAL